MLVDIVFHLTQFLFDGEFGGVFVFLDLGYFVSEGFFHALSYLFLGLRPG